MEWSSPSGWEPTTVMLLTTSDTLTCGSASCRKMMATISTYVHAVIGIYFEESQSLIRYLIKPVNSTKLIGLITLMLFHCQLLDVVQAFRRSPNMSTDHRPVNKLIVVVVVVVVSVVVVAVVGETVVLVILINLIYLNTRTRPSYGNWLGLWLVMPSGRPRKPLENAEYEWTYYTG